MRVTVPGSPFTGFQPGISRGQTGTLLGCTSGRGLKNPPWRRSSHVMAARQDWQRLNLKHTLTREKSGFLNKFHYFSQLASDANSFKTQQSKPNLAIARIQPMDHPFTSYDLDFGIFQNNRHCPSQRSNLRGRESLDPRGSSRVCSSLASKMRSQHSGCFKGLTWPHCKMLHSTLDVGKVY